VDNSEPSGLNFVLWLVVAGTQEHLNFLLVALLEKQAIASPIRYWKVPTITMALPGFGGGLT